MSTDVQDDSDKKLRTETVHHQLKFELNAKESEVIQRLMKNYCMIETVGEAFDKALQDIYRYFFVGLTIHVGKKGCVVRDIHSCPRLQYLTLSLLVQHQKNWPIEGMAKVENTYKGHTQRT